MHFVVLGDHSPEICPTSNAKTKDLLLELAPQIPKLAERNGVKIVAGPFVNHEHLTVTVLEAGTAEAVDQFLVDSRLAQWNRCRILPSKPMVEGMQEIQAHPSLF